MIRSPAQERWFLLNHKVESGSKPRKLYIYCKNFRSVILFYSTEGRNKHLRSGWGKSYNLRNYTHFLSESPDLFKFRIKWFKKQRILSTGLSLSHSFLWLSCLSLQTGAWLSYKDSRYSTWSPHSFLSANLYSNLYSGILFLCATLDILTSLALLLP